jgi:uncharacterized membrane protein YvlD (DUF360 family)
MQVNQQWISDAIITTGIYSFVLTADTLEMVRTVLDDIAEVRYVAFRSWRFTVALMVDSVNRKSGVY